jgi:hypothetical protein
LFADSSDPFGSDPFGDFGSQTAAPTPATKMAPPLSAAQLSQHKQWMHSVLAGGSGRFYDDGTLQISATVEVRGSQCRITLNYSNGSPANITDMAITIQDTASMLRMDTGKAPTALNALSNATQVMMVGTLRVVNADNEE